MKNRWILNLVLLALIAGLVAFLYLRPKTEIQSAPEHEVSQLKLAGITAVKVEFPAKAAVTFNKVDGYWQMTAPYNLRADQLSVQRILSVVAATSKSKFPTTDLAKYGLDNPLVKLTLAGEGGDATFVYGTYNTVTDEQYVAYKEGVYLLNAAYSEAASTQVTEMIDKNMLAPSENKQLVGFDFARLDWEDTLSNVAIEKGQWSTKKPKVTLVQNDMNEWLEFSWKQNPAKSVETYTPNLQEKYPSFKVKLANGKTVHIDVLIESPSMMLARPDEGLVYSFANDVGTSMLSPPHTLK
ncbi:MAG: DUF4340 domain-containing protein [Methylophilaceae bacterium]